MTDRQACRTLADTASLAERVLRRVGWPRVGGPDSDDVDRLEALVGRLSLPPESVWAAAWCLAQRGERGAAYLALGLDEVREVAEQRAVEAIDAWVAERADAMRPGECLTFEGTAESYAEGLCAMDRDHYLCAVLDDGSLCWGRSRSSGRDIGDLVGQVAPGRVILDVDMAGGDPVDSILGSIEQPALGLAVVRVRAEES